MVKASSVGSVRVVGDGEGVWVCTCWAGFLRKGGDQQMVEA